MNPHRLEAQQIGKAVLAALVLGVVVFTGAALPAEYGKDPLGTGKLLGLNGQRHCSQYSTKRPIYPL